MRPDVAANYQWGRKFLPEMKRIVGEHLIGEAPADEDMQRNTDLIVLRLEAIRIACRVRRHKYLSLWPGEFTIRSDVRNGGETELGKVLSGWGDYNLYGIADERDEQLACWVLGDLRVFRLWFQRQTVTRHGIQPGVERDNGDGSRFRAFAIAAMPIGYVIARRAATLPQLDLDAEMDRIADISLGVA